jgi:hypothetical protein
MVMVADELLVSIILVAEGPLIKVRLVMPSVMAISSQVPALEKPKAYWDSTDALLVTEPPEIMMLLVWTPLAPLLCQDDPMPGPICPMALTVPPLIVKVP